MRPHLITPPESVGPGTPEPTSPDRINGMRMKRLLSNSLLSSADEGEMHDIIGVGFGPASLAIAVALHDRLETRSDLLPPKVAFLEKQQDFAWHSGMQIPGATMQISWIKDLATMRNPRSHFTFLNYLHEAGRLVRFSNLGTFLPKRVEYEAYMKWAARHFEHVVSYHQECVEVLPQRQDNADCAGSSPVTHWLVRTRNLYTGHVEQRYSKHVILATGGQPRIPPHLPQDDPRVIHSSRFMSQTKSLFPNKAEAYTMLILGAGQSAAEIFHYLYSEYPNAKVRLLIRGSSLKPSDDSPFVNETFNPEHVDDVFSMEEHLRSASILDEKATNYGVVRLELLERIYADMYEESVRHPSRTEERLRARILPFREVVHVDASNKTKKLVVSIQNREALYRINQEHCTTTDCVDADALFVAAGYNRNAHEQILQGATDLLPDEVSKTGRWPTKRDYSVRFREDAVARDAGIWLQGCNEGTHGLSDTLLSILAVRGGEVAGKICDQKRSQP